eukprot:PhM_4_TR13606/c0_g1_i1/m.51670
MGCVASDSSTTENQTTTLFSLASASIGHEDDRQTLVNKHNVGSDSNSSGNAIVGAVVSQGGILRSPTLLYRRPSDSAHSIGPAASSVSSSATSSGRSNIVSVVLPSPPQNGSQNVFVARRSCNDLDAFVSDDDDDDNDEKQSGKEKFRSVATRRTFDNVTPWICNLSTAQQHTIATIPVASKSKIRECAVDDCGELTEGNLGANEQLLVSLAAKKARSGNNKKKKMVPTKKSKVEKVMNPLSPPVL